MIYHAEGLMLLKPSRKEHYLNELYTPTNFRHKHVHCLGGHNGQD